MKTVFEVASLGDLFMYFTPYRGIKNIQNHRVNYAFAETRLVIELANCNNANILFVHKAREECDAKTMLMSAARSGLVIIDLQERLQPAIDGGDEIARRAGILLEAAATLDIPALVTEQYPRGLGSTLPEIEQKCGKSTKVYSKLTFSAGKNVDVAQHIDKWRKKGRTQAVVCGTEAHICVLQTVADLIAQGRDVYLVTDACGSRTADNRTAAISRMTAMGVTCVTTEMVLFEWLEVAGTNEFKTLSKLIR